MTQFNKSSNQLPRNLDYGLSLTLKVIGGKWKPALIDCIARGIQCPPDMQKAIPQASLTLINQHLRELVAYELLQKENLEESASNPTYRLTEFGKTLLPIIEAMQEWGESYALEVAQIIRIKDSKA